jgi:outer membrane lipoprotein-sorting protein
MKRRVLSVVAYATVVLAGAHLAAQNAENAAQNVDDLVARNVLAKGGTDKLQAVRTMKQTAHITSQGMTGTITVYGKRPNLVRQEIVVAGQRIVNAFDGTTAWSINPLMGSPEPKAITGPQADDIKMQADFDSPLVDYKEKGYELEFVGQETLGTRKVFHLKLTSKEHRVQQLYLDAETNLEIKIVGDSQTGPVENELSDYREIQGLKLPFMMRTVAAGNVVSQIVVDSVELNPKIDDTMFKMPKASPNAIYNGLPSFSCSRSR